MASTGIMYPSASYPVLIPHIQDLRRYLMRPTIITAPPASGRLRHDRGRFAGPQGFLFFLMRRGFSIITLVSGGTDSVSQTLPPMSERAPITVSPPRIVAPA